ncbi:transmembrane protein 266-like [Salvelinus sp. IW2-2015]|uniref:transmembrane protein 266-like n=1 Tax=Salvelinus sp. IW2-2015 TaxID=2691554 RepID=UPI0038D3CB0D
MKEVRALAELCQENNLLLNLQQQNEGTDLWTSGDSRGRTPPSYHGARVEKQLHRPQPQGSPEGVRSGQCINGGTLPALQDIYSTWCHRKAKKIIKDDLSPEPWPVHPSTIQKSLSPLSLSPLSLSPPPLSSIPLSSLPLPRSNWLKPCCGRRVALWQVCLLSAGFNCFLVALVILVVVFLTLELLIDTKHLQFANAIQFASVIHWISLAILSLFFTETVFRIVVLGIWDYIENKVEVFDGAVIVLSLAPMVASTVANGPSSPWDAISLIITLRIWRVKRIIDGRTCGMPVARLPGPLSLPLCSPRP